MDGVALRLAVPGRGAAGRGVSPRCPPPSPAGPAGKPWAGWNLLARVLPVFLHPGRRFQRCLIHANGQAGLGRAGEQQGLAAGIGVVLSRSAFLARSGEPWWGCPWQGSAPRSAGFVACCDCSGRWFLFGAGDGGSKPHGAASRGQSGERRGGTSAVGPEERGRRRRAGCGLASCAVREGRSGEVLSACGPTGGRRGRAVAAGRICWFS